MSESPVLKAFIDIRSRAHQMRSRATSIPAGRSAGRSLRSGPMGNLTDTAIRGDMVPGKYGDGDGLWLFVSPTGAKRFVFRFKIDGRENSIALGPYPALALAKA